MTERLPWFERTFAFGLPPAMLPLLLERLDGTTVRVAEKVRSIPNNLLSQRFGGKWSVKQNIGHLAEVDMISNKRIDEIVAGADLLSPAVFEPQDYNPWPIEKVLSFFLEARKSNLERYARLNLQELTRASTHPRLKTKMTPVDLAYFDAEHDDHHLLKISDIIKVNARS
jgi:hypothetical protein